MHNTNQCLKGHARGRKTCYCGRKMGTSSPRKANSSLENKHLEDKHRATRKLVHCALPPQNAAAQESLLQHWLSRASVKDIRTPLMILPNIGLQRHHAALFRSLCRQADSPLQLSAAVTMSSSTTSCAQKSENISLPALKVLLGM